MQEELATIDVSPLEALGRIKQELDTLETRLTAMEQKRDAVAAPVYMRVRADYESRRRALEDEAAPLQATAREQYARLRELLQRSEADHETTRLDREEVEFRYTLGEFDEAEYKKRLKAVDKQLADKAAARQQAEGMKQRFVAVFRSEAELEMPIPSMPAGTAPTRKLETLKPEQLGNYDTNPGVVAPPPPAPPPSPVQSTTVMQVPTAAAGATQMMRAIRPQDIAAAAAAPPPAAAPAPPPRSDSTMIMRTARLVPQNAEAGKQTLTLALKPTTFGSDDGCDVRLGAAPRRAAEIRVSMAGFTLSDEGGKVKVNGVAVTQHLLRHEDVVEIANAKFVFKEG